MIFCAIYIFLLTYLLVSVSQSFISQELTTDEAYSSDCSRQSIWSL